MTFPNIYYKTRQSIHKSQGRKQLPKAGWASSNATLRHCPVVPAILPKPGWAIAHSVHQPFTPLNKVGASLPKLCHKILGYASYEKVSRFSGSRKFLSNWKPQYLLHYLSENIRFSKAFNKSLSDCAVQCQITHILLEICQ